MDRRAFLASSVFLVPTIVRVRQARPLIVGGVQSGDPRPDGALVWAQADRTSRMVVDYSTTERFADARRLVGPVVTEETDFTGRVALTGVAPGQTVFYRVQFEDRSGRERSEPTLGRTRTAPSDRRSVRFTWSADTVGQGFGINPDRGGLVTYDAVRRRESDFFIHSGDNIYADGPVPAEVRLPDGAIWRNVVTEAKSKVAETLEEYRGNYRYNLLDEHVRRFNSETCQVWQWDDHEVTNNWSPTSDLDADDRYRVKDVALLSARGRRAFLEYAPISSTGTRRIHRRISYGPLLDVFVIDLRSYRGPNGYNRQERAGPDTAYFGAEQMGWLKGALRASDALWKVIASDMPLGLIVPDGTDRDGRPRFENGANGDGPPLGRELEVADLLSDIKRNQVRNVVWVTGDVHYAAAHFYDPALAQFSDFDAFWEFVAGPLHAGSFGPSALDDTFGPRVVFQRHPTGDNPDRSPRAGYQFFGEVRIEGDSGEMIVSLLDGDGTVVYATTLAPTETR